MSVICCVSVQYFVNADITVFGIYSINYHLKRTMLLIFLDNIQCT